MAPDSTQIKDRSLHEACNAILFLIIKYSILKEWQKPNFSPSRYFQTSPLISWRRFCCETVAKHNIQGCSSTNSQSRQAVLQVAAVHTRCAPSKGRSYWHSSYVTANTKHQETEEALGVEPLPVTVHRESTGEMGEIWEKCVGTDYRATSTLAGPGWHAGSLLDWSPEGTKSELVS